MADLNLRAGTNMSIRQEDTDLYLDNTYEYDDTEIQQDLLTRSLITETGNKIELTLNNTNYKMTAILKDKYGNVISTSSEIDLPIESLVVSIYYDSTTKELVFVLKDGTTTRVPLLDLIDGLATEEDLQTLEDDINEDIETFKGDVEQELEKAQQELNQYKMLENALPKVEGEGETIHLEDTAKCPMKVGLKGQIQQASTTGVNILNNTLESVKACNTSGTWNNNVYSYAGMTFTYNNNGSITISGTNDSSSTRYFYYNTSNNLWVLPAGSYTKVSYDKGQTVNANVGLQTRQDGFSGTDIFGSGNTLKTTTLTEQTTIGVRLSISGSASTNVTVYPMLLNGTYTSETIPDYEPYTNGASPSPSYPQDIHIVSGDNTIKVCNKNLFDNVFRQGNINAYSIANRITSNNILYLKEGIYTISTNLDLTSYKYAVVVTSVPTPTINANILFDSSWNTSSYTLNLTIDGYVNILIARTNQFETEELPLSILQGKWFQLEKGSAATSYVEHKEYTKEINLGDIEVGGIGDYEDEFFKNTIDSEYYDNTLELDKWYLKKRIGKVVLDGTETGWNFASTDTNTSRFYIAISNKIDGTTENASPLLLSNYFTPETFHDMYYNDVEAIAPYGGSTDSSRKRVYLRISNSLATTTDALKTWLSTHNTIVYYVLATPTNTLLNDTLQETLDSFYSYQEQTNISQENNDIPFVIKASAIYDLTDLVNRVATLETE